MPKLDPHRNFKFNLEIDGITQGGFTKVALMTDPSGIPPTVVPAAVPGTPAPGTPAPARPARPRRSVASRRCSHRTCASAGTTTRP